MRTKNEKSIDANADSFGYSLVSNIAKVLVILFALFQCFILVMCCSPRPSITTSRNPLISLKDKGEYPPCVIEDKKIYHYVQEQGIGTLEHYHGFKDVKDKGVILYEDLYSPVQLPLISYFKPYVGWLPLNSSISLRFFIYEKENEYVVYYYGDSPDVEAQHISVENIVVENNPFSKKLVVKRLDPSRINKLYLKDALCYGVD